MGGESSHSVDGEGVTLELLHSELLHSCILELTQKIDLLMKNSEGGGLDDNKTLYKEHDVVFEDDVDAMAIPNKRKRGDPINGSKHPPGVISVTPMANQVVENKPDGSNVQSKAFVSLNEYALVGIDDAKYSLMETTEDDVEVLIRYKCFKKYDTVINHLYQYFSHSSELMKFPNEWVENIRKDLKDLREHLPEGMYARFYESRMDLLTVVIIGPKDTPYDDGLFFFDVWFPDRYPDVAPLVIYQSSSFSIHPIDDVKPQAVWVPGTSNLLQVMVHLRSIFNGSPLFDGSLCVVNSPEENKQASLVHNEDIIVKNLKTMVRLMEEPPKDFVHLVVGHFRFKASRILRRVRRHQQAVEVHSKTFKSDLDSCITPLIAAFKKIGVKDADKLVAPNKFESCGL